MSLFVSLLRDGKQWVSEKYLQTMNEEINKNQLRMNQLNELKRQQKENEHKEKYRDFIDKNPEFAESVKTKNKNFNISEEIMDNLVFSEWKIAGGLVHVGVKGKTPYSSDRLVH